MYTPETKISFTNIGHDVNGNRRIVCSWLSIPGANSYDEAVKLANKIGGRKYHTKSYGGGIVFQGNPSEVQRNIDTVLKGQMPTMPQSLRNIANKVAAQSSLLKIGDTVVWLHEPYTKLIVTERIGDHGIRAEDAHVFCEDSETMFIKIERITT